MFGLPPEATTLLFTTVTALTVAAITGYYTHRGVKTKGQFDYRTEAERREDAAHARGTEAQIKFVEQMQERCAKLEKDIDTLGRRVMSADAEMSAINRRWRHLVNGLIAYASILKTRAEAVGVSLPPFNGFARFQEEGGQVEDHWHGHLGLGDENGIIPIVGPGITILVVDDDRAYTKILASHINVTLKQGAHIVTRAREAAACLRLPQFKVAVIDLNLPDGHGLDVILQAGAEGAKLPFIILTGDADLQIPEEQMREARIVRVMIKGQDRMAEIVEQIRRCLAGDC